MDACSCGHEWSDHGFEDKSWYKGCRMGVCPCTKTPPAPSTVDRDALLEAALKFAQEAMNGAGECSDWHGTSWGDDCRERWEAFLASPSLAAWRREMGT